MNRHNPAVRLLRHWLPVLLIAAACTPGLDWREYRPPDGRFVVLFPQKPGKSERRLATPAGEVMMHMYSVRVEETVLGAGFADFATPPDKTVLGAMRDALVKNIGGRLAGERAVAAGGYAGIEIVATGVLGAGERSAPAELRARLLVRERRYVQLVVAGRKAALSESDVDFFLSSFKPD